MFAFMLPFFERMDRLAGIDPSNTTDAWLERLAFIFLILTFAFAPHSIAATQSAWLIGMTVWLVRSFRSPRPSLKFGLLDAGIIGLFLWTVITALASYDPPTSLVKLKGAGAFLIFYFAVSNLRSFRSVFFVGLVLIGSCMVNVVWVPIERAIGRGVEIHQVDPRGPLSRALLEEGDTLLSANRQPLSSPEILLEVLERDNVVDLKFYRPDFDFTVKVERDWLLGGPSANEKLGIGHWDRSHNWRSDGFYGHYTTYAEVLQLIGSLLLGILVASFSVWRYREPTSVGGQPTLNAIMLLGVGFLLLAFALLLTITRAPQLALIISAFSIVLLGLGRKWLVISAMLIVPIAIGGLIFLERSREVGFFDSKDESTRYRTVMFKDGIRIWSDSPRNMFFGVGMDSVKKYWSEWGMFEGGKMPVSHFHSTPLQLLVERGIPGLAFWMLLMGAYLRSLWRWIENYSNADWRARGILLGCFGATVGFLVSSVVHYNFGDQEVAMTFYLLMAMAVGTGRALGSLNTNGRELSKS